MIEDDTYEGPAYYFYEYNNIAEFGYFDISKYKGSRLTFSCKVNFLFGYNSNTSTSENRMSSNQLHGQNTIRHIYQNWFLDLEEFSGHERTVIIKTIFEARDRIMVEIK